MSHPADQKSELQRNPWPAGLALSTPEQLEALPVPTDEGSGSYDRQPTAPIEQAAEPQQRQACRMGDPMGLDFAFSVEGELFAQEEILSGKRVSGS